MVGRVGIEPTTRGLSCQLEGTPSMRSPITFALLGFIQQRNILFQFLQPSTQTKRNHERISVIGNYITVIVDNPVT